MKDNKGFTLIEILVLVSIIAIITTVLALVVRAIKLEVACKEGDNKACGELEEMDKGSAKRIKCNKELGRCNYLCANDEDNNFSDCKSRCSTKYDYCLTK